MCRMRCEQNFNNKNSNQTLTINQGVTPLIDLPWEIMSSALFIVFVDTNGLLFFLEPVQFTAMYILLFVAICTLVTLSDISV